MAAERTYFMMSLCVNCMTYSNTFSFDFSDLHSVYTEYKEVHSRLVSSVANELQNAMPLSIYLQPRDIFCYECYDYEYSVWTNWLDKF